ncbi:3-hydroxyacyl-CoA dehydrogenase/enoyl-CoA hydratase family protein [Martelella mediterranea]|uniref:3-hydroxyacyl-CoA dehydrogenase n=1 Tax=Martelella mediterranea TaxID=293089 RepID=A0A4R3NX35_9HYPH|nr:3-hydroxyacyl-CoA dehydrogenase/enoyl-CoA hydratase family protein [Martelella mediterranea]TCT44934.1 3-hydroxyacyl-CoA dehydrogenase [Martelella mediterranea]
MSKINKVAVIGAGVMGSGIAAQVANAGHSVLLLDIVPEGAENRNIIAETALQKMMKADPAPFMSKRAAKLVETGNVEDDLEKLADVDWVIEVVIEKLDVKQALYRRIDTVRKPGTAISSNTSTIPLEKLVEGMPEAFQRDFMITHFFNPPRYMRLMELVLGAKTDKALAQSVEDFADRKLGKSVVHCNDRPGFVANRLGTTWIQLGVLKALEEGLSVEEADAVMGKPFGIPKTGIFGLIDLVGLDLMPHIGASLKSTLPEGDLFHETNRDLPLVNRMIEEGYTGRKGKGGFYRLNRATGQKIKEGIDLETGEYRVSVKPDHPKLKAAKKPRQVLEIDGPLGRYALGVMTNTLAYAARLVGDAADDIASIDEVMRLGYNWRWGPFELVDLIGSEWLVAKMRENGIDVPELLDNLGDKTFYRIEDGRRQALQPDGSYRDIARPEGVIMLEDFKRTQEPLLKNGSAAVWDIGDDVLCFEFTSKANAMDDQIMDLLNKTIGLVKRKYKALVIYNEGTNFSVGANLGLALFVANIAAWGEIEKLVSSGQSTYKKMKYAPFPVVAAPSGMALGGGCEVLLHVDAVQAHAESYIGLVECGVGLVPAWGGCKEMLTRWQKSGKLPNGPMPAASKVFEMISTATVAKSAEEARELMFLKTDDAVTMNRYRLLADAKAKALSLVDGYQPPEPEEVYLPGPAGKVAFQMAAEGFARRGIATPHDLTVADELATVLSGGQTDIFDTMDEDAIMELEQDSFMRLVKNNKTLARFESVVETGKPLRN